MMEYQLPPFDGKQFAAQLATRDATRVGEALAGLSQATRIIYTTSDGHKIESQIIRELKMYGGLEKIFELITSEKGLIQDYCITVLSGLTISSNEVGVATNQNRLVVQELLSKVKNFTKDSSNLVLGLVQNLSFHFQNFRIRMAYEIGVLERIVKILEAEVPKPIIAFDANSYIYSGAASPRFSLFIILSNIAMEKSLRPRLFDLGVIGLCSEMLRKPLSNPSFPGDADNGEGSAVEIVAQLAELPQIKDAMLQKYGSLTQIIPQPLNNHPNQKTRDWYNVASNLLGNPLHSCSNTVGIETCPKKESTTGSFRSCTCQRAWYCSDQCQRSHWPAHSRECAAINPELVENIQKRKEEGNTLFSIGDYLGAINSFTQALHLCTRQEDLPLDCATLLVNRAASYVKLKELEKAIQDCTRALELSPQYMKAFVWRGSAYQSLGHYRAALEDLCIAYTMVDSSNTKNKDIRDMQLFCCEKLLETKIRVLPVNKDKKSKTGFNLLHIPPDIDSLDSVVRILKKNETPLRSKLIEARRCWEMGVQLAERGEYEEAAAKLGDALAIDERLLPIDILVINNCLQNSKNLGLETLLLSTFLAMHTGRITDADNILSQSIDSLKRPTTEREVLYLSRFYELRTISRCMLGNRKGGLEDLECVAAINPDECEHLYAKAKIIQGKVDPNTLLLPHFIQVEKLLVEFLSRADSEEKRVPFSLYNLSYLYCIKRDMLRAKEYFRKAVEAEKIAAVLWGSELDIESDIPRKLAFILLKNDLDQREANGVKAVQMRIDVNNM